MNYSDFISATFSCWLPSIKCSIASVFLFQGSFKPVSELNFATWKISITSSYQSIWSCYKTINNYDLGSYCHQKGSTLSFIYIISGVGNPANQPCWFSNLSLPCPLLIIWTRCVPPSGWWHTPGPGNQKWMAGDPAGLSLSRTMVPYPCYILYDQLLKPTI